MSTAPRLHDALRLDESSAEEGVAVLRGRAIPVPGDRVYGGQVLAQAVLAAASTVDDDRLVHSAHAYFLRAGRLDAPLNFRVERTRDGRSFSARRVEVEQRGAVIFSAMLSFQSVEPGVTHATTVPPGLPGPDDLPVRDSYGPGRPGEDGYYAEDLIEIRDVPAEATASLTGAVRAAWARIRRPLPDDPAAHRAALAYLSDAHVQDAILGAHGLNWYSPGTSMASLDHSMWWYLDGRADEWLLTVQESPVSGGGRGLGTTRIFAADGRLLAVAAQEMMLRVDAAPSA